VARAVYSVINILLILALSANIVCAGEAAPAASDPGLEKRVNAISEELRCLVCQNQSLADSHADLAIDLKNQVREKLKQGMSERQIVDYMVERYGDFVLYRPPLKATTFLLWFGPFLLLVAGLIGLFVRLARRGRSAPETLSESERARATALLDVGNEAGPR
jgi:cytochrome c-type biogenesis protein CcmH